MAVEVTEPPLDQPKEGDPWKERLPPWTSEPTGPDVVYLLRICSEDRCGGQSPYQWVSHYDPFQESRGTLKLTDRVGTEDFAYPDFRPVAYPDHGYVVPKFDNPRSEIYSGIYGFIDGIGDWTDIPRYKNATWQVIAVVKSECRFLETGGTARAPRGWVVYSGDALGALFLIIPRMARNPRLREAACDDDVQFWGRLVRQESACSEIRSDTDNVVSFASESIAFTYGFCKFAVASEGVAHSYGVMGCAVVLNGGTAISSGACSDAIAQVTAQSVARSETQTFASASGLGNAVALGPLAAARAGLGGAIFLTEYRKRSMKPAHVFAGIVDGVKLKPDVWYKLKDGEPVECEGPN